MSTTESYTAKQIMDSIAAIRKAAEDGMSLEHMLEFTEYSADGVYYGLCKPTDASDELLVAFEKTLGWGGPGHEDLEAECKMLQELVKLVHKAKGE